jgi:predicted enzyme related to lactoylglutathione lyase
MTQQDNAQTPQPLSLTSIRVGSSQPAVLAEFYEKFFGRPPDIQNGPFHMWHGSGCSFRVSDHSELTGPTQEPGRILLNFDTRDVKGEFERLKALGLTIVKEPYATGGRADYWVATLADPDGNLVQLTTPLEMLAPRPGN